MFIVQSINDFDYELSVKFSQNSTKGSFSVLGYLKGRGGLFMGSCPKINAIDTEYLIATT